MTSPVITIAELLNGKRPKMPLTILPYIPATKKVIAAATDTLFEEGSDYPPAA